MPSSLTHFVMHATLYVCYILHGTCSGLLVCPRVCLFVNLSVFFLEPHCKLLTLLIVLCLAMNCLLCSIVQTCAFRCQVCSCARPHETWAELHGVQQPNHPLGPAVQQQRR